MSSVSVPIPALDPPWPDDLKIAVVTAHDAPSGWRRLAHEVAAAAQPGGHSFPLAERPPGRGSAEQGRAAFLYRKADRVHGYLCLASKIVTGYRDPLRGYRQAAGTERVIRSCVIVIWVDAELRRQGVARQLADAAARRARVTASGLAWAEPFTDSGYLLAKSITPNGLWIADYS
jgi:GNAT superfamily N-acetyltransferase